MIQIQHQLNQIEEMMEEMSEYIHLFKKMQFKITQSVEQIRTQIEEMNNKQTYPLRELLPDNGIDEFTHTLTSWTERSVGRIIYEGTLDIDQLKETLPNKKNVLILIGSGNNVFGSYHDRIVNKNEWCVDLHHFVFTLKNQFHVPPTKFKRVAKDKVMTVVENNNYLYKINGFGSFGTHSFIDYLFPSHYHDSIGMGGDIFTGNVYLNTFSIDYIMVLEMRLTSK